MPNDRLGLAYGQKLKKKPKASRHSPEKRDMKGFVSDWREAFVIEENPSCPFCEGSMQILLNDTHVLGDRPCLNESP
jgi:hypothetical protein